jgi:hypothetical protein
LSDKIFEAKMTPIKITKGLPSLFPKDIHFAIAGVLCFILGSISAFFWGLGGPTLLLLFIVFLPMGLIATLISLIYMFFTLVRKWPQLAKPTKTVRFVLAGTLLIFTCFFFFADGFTELESLAMRLNVARTGGIDQLQAWAMDVLEKPLEDIIVAPDKYLPLLKDELYSEQVKKMHPMRVRVSSDSDNRYIVIQIGGGGFVQTDWGIVITPPSTSFKTDRASLIKWRDGFYAFFGKVPMT